MKTAIFLSARDKAKRLPRKLFLEVKGKPIIGHLIDRLKLAKLPDLIVLCTSVNPDDLTLVEVAKSNGIQFFQGSEDDKLDRYLKAAERFGVDFMTVVDGDDIFCDPECIDRIIEKFRETKADYIVFRDLPLGVTAFGVSHQGLKKVCGLKEENDTEVWGAYFTDSGLFRVDYLEAEPELRHPEYRMTLDYQEDFDFFKAVFEKLYVPGRVFALKDIISLLEREPEIAGINSGVQKLYEEHLKKSASVKLKNNI
jgi:spore coat polysaccharide biosynthesis protein SpsF